VRIGQSWIEGAGTLQMFSRKAKMFGVGLANVLHGASGTEPGVCHSVIRATLQGLLEVLCCQLKRSRFHLTEEPATFGIFGFGI